MVRSPWKITCLLGCNDEEKPDGIDSFTFLDRERIKSRIYQHQKYSMKKET